MYGCGVKPAQYGSVIKFVPFVLYVQPLKGTIPTIKSSNDQATVQGKLNKLVDAKVLLRSAFLSDVLTEAKRFSLIFQKKDIKVIKMLNAIKTTKSN